MADAPIVHIGENSPEQVAYKLMISIGLSEDKKLHGVYLAADRDWLLSTYSRCWHVAKYGTYEKPR